METVVLLLLCQEYLIIQICGSLTVPIILISFLEENAEFERKDLEGLLRVLGVWSSALS